MKYLCLGYFDPVKTNAITQAQADAIMGECPAHMDTLYRSGQVASVAGVAAEAKRLRRVDGKVEITDGSIAENPAVVGCVFLIEAVDMEDAVRVAALHPTTQVSAGEQLGWQIEVRPVNYFRD